MNFSRYPYSGICLAFILKRNFYFSELAVSRREFSQDCISVFLSSGFLFLIFLPFFLLILTLVLSLAHFPPLPTFISFPSFFLFLPIERQVAIRGSYCWFPKCLGRKLIISSSRGTVSSIIEREGFLQDLQPLSLNVELPACVSWAVSFQWHMEGSWHWWG